MWINLPYQPLFHGTNLIERPHILFEELLFLSHQHVSQCVSTHELSSDTQASGIQGSINCACKQQLKGLVWKHTHYVLLNTLQLQH